MASAPKKWQDRVILADEHGPELEQRAAELEFKERLHRDAAEAQAYREYHSKHVMAAAAHHLRGMKAAQGSGDMDEARKHGAMYEMHMKKLGLDPWQEPPRELKAAMSADDRQAAHKFKAHPGDTFVVEEHKAKQAAKLVKAQLEELHLKAKAIVLLRKAFPTNPHVPVGSDLEPELESKYLTHSQQPHEIVERMATGRSAIHQRVIDANLPIRGKPIKPYVGPGEQPNKDQRDYKAGMTAAPMETKVAVDHLLERGFKPEVPRNVKPGAPYGGDVSGPRIITPNSMAMSRHNVESLSALDEGAGTIVSSPLINPPEPAHNTGLDRVSPWNNRRREPIEGGNPGSYRLKDRTDKQRSTALDNDFWTALNQSVGLPHGEPITNPEDAAAMEQSLRAGQMKKISLPFFKPKPQSAAPAPAVAVKPGVRPYEAPGQAETQERMKLLQSIPPKVPKQPAGMAAPAKSPAFSVSAPTAASPGRVPAKPASSMSSGPTIQSAPFKPTLPSSIPGYNRQETAGLQRILATTPRDPKRGMGKSLTEIVDLAKSQPLDTSSPVFNPGQLVGHEGRNLVVVKVHEGHGLGQPHLYTLRDPVDNTLSHAFEAKLTPTKDQNNGRN